VCRTLSPENRKASRISHNTHGKKDLESSDSMYGIRNNSSNSALRPSNRPVGQHSDERMSKRKQNLDCMTAVDDEIVSSIMSVS
jgi:hypothetical protein